MLPPSSARSTRQTDLSSLNSGLAGMDSSSQTPRDVDSSNSGSSTSTGSKSFHIPSVPAEPAQFLITDARVAQWATTPGYQGFMAWLKRRCERIRGRSILPAEGYEGSCDTVKTLLKMLDAMRSWVDEVPPQPQSAQRFGNLAFRDYIKLVEARLPDFFSDPSFPPHLRAQILPLLLDSHAFGHPTRLDYGTGHELAFALGLWCATVSGWAETEEDQDELVLRVFPRYLEVVTLLQRTYRLEPAGSHGVWGLDDYCFLPYLFGSAQLLGFDGSTPSSALSNALKLSATSTSPTSLSVAPTSPPEISDMYTLSLFRVTLFKSGAAFSEHSPLLHSLSQLPTWSKPHSGLVKMFQGEVVGKRVVVQGLWVGGWCWGDEMPRAVGERVAGRGAGNIGAVHAGDPGIGVGTGTGTGTTAPWADRRVEDANRQWATRRS